MLQPVIPDRREDYEKVPGHASSAILETKAGSGLYSTPGTRRLDRLTTPAEAAQMVSKREHLPTVVLLRQLCMKAGKFVAVVQREIKFLLQEKYEDGMLTSDLNRIIENERSKFLNILLERIGLSNPVLKLIPMPDDWAFTVSLTGANGNCEPLSASLWHLVNMGALNIVGRSEEGVILEPTERLFSSTGVSENFQVENDENGENSMTA